MIFVFTNNNNELDYFELCIEYISFFFFWIFFCVLCFEKKFLSHHQVRVRVKIWIVANCVLFPECPNFIFINFGMPSVSILKYPNKPKIYNLYLYLPSVFLIMVYGINLELIYYRFLGNFCFSSEFFLVFQRFGWSESWR